MWHEQEDKCRWHFDFCKTQGNVHKEDFLICSPPPQHTHTHTMVGYGWVGGKKNWYPSCSRIVNLAFSGAVSTLTQQYKTMYMNIFQ